MTVSTNRRVLLIKVRFTFVTRGVTFKVLTLLYSFEVFLSVSNGINSPKISMVITSMSLKTGSNSHFIFYNGMF